MYAVNNAALELFGVDRDTAMQLGWGDLLADFEQTDELVEFLAALEREEEPLPVHTRYWAGDGTIYHIGISVSLLIEYDKVFGILLVFSDNTELVEAHMREVEVLEETACKMNNLSSAIAHQIRNPLQIIGGFNGLVRRKIHDDKVAPYLDGIDESARRLGDVVNGVTAVTQIQVGKCGSVPLASSIEAIRVHWIESRGSNALSVEWDIALFEVDVLADYDLLRKSLCELFDNSLDFASDLPVRIRLGTDVLKDTVRILVADNGPGMAEDILPFVFDPFFTTKAVGVGMGLCIVERALHAMGGSVSVVSDPGEGVAFGLIIPCATTAGDGAGHCLISEV